MKAKMILLVSLVFLCLFITVKNVEVLSPDEHLSVNIDVKNGIATVLPSNIVLGASQKYALGSASAPLTLYEYSSLGCPHCSDFHNDILPKLKEEYIDKGQLRVIFVNFPLDKKSMKAALLSNCLTYENYFGFLNRLFDIAYSPSLVIIAGFFKFTKQN